MATTNPSPEHFSVIVDQFCPSWRSAPVGDPSPYARQAPTTTKLSSLVPGTSYTFTLNGGPHQVRGLPGVDSASYYAQLNVEIDGQAVYSAMAGNSPGIPGQDTATSRFTWTASKPDATMIWTNDCMSGAAGFRYDVDITVAHSAALSKPSPQHFQATAVQFCPFWQNQPQGPYQKSPPFVQTLSNLMPGTVYAFTISGGSRVVQPSLPNVDNANYYAQLTVTIDGEAVFSAQAIGHPDAPGQGQMASTVRWTAKGTEAKMVWEVTCYSGGIAFTYEVDVVIAS